VSGCLAQLTADVLCCTVENLHIFLSTVLCCAGDCKLSNPGSACSATAMHDLCLGVCAESVRASPPHAGTRQRNSKYEYLRCVSLADDDHLFVGTNHGAVHRVSLPVGAHI